VIGAGLVLLVAKILIARRAGQSSAHG